MASAVRLHRRRERLATGMALLEGPVVVGEAAAAGARLDVVFATPEDTVAPSLARSAGARLVVVSGAVLGRVSTTSSPQSPVATAHIPPSELPATGHLLVAWGVGDPGNAGTLIRVAAAFGLGYVAGPGAADTWSPKVVRSAAGAHFRTSVGAVADVEALRRGGRQVVAAVARGGDPPRHLDVDSAILIGSEAHGLGEDAVDMADELVTIPMMPGAESLNAAVAGAIIAYAAGRATP